MPAEFQLLSHIIAAGCDARYRRALRFERVFELGKPRALRRALNGAFGAREESSEKEESSDDFGRLCSRAGRPVSLGLELVRGAASYAVSRLPRRGR